MLALRPADPVLPDPRLEGLRVLLVDDDPDTLELLAFVLGRTGAEVRCCRSAAEARAGVYARPPHVVVTDLSMPFENGLCVLRDVIALRPFAPHPVRAILLTAHADPGTRETAEALGFDRVIAKPVDPVQVVEEIAGALGR